jgi:putative endonuclease
MEIVHDSRVRHLLVGRAGEDLAARFLEHRGQRVIGRNIRVDADEVDLVIDGVAGTAAVEVKSSVNGDDPLEAVGDAKFRRLERAVSGLPGRIDRIDLVGIAADESGVTIRWLRGVR